MRRRRATVATPGEWQCGVQRLAVANGPNIFQMLLVFFYCSLFDHSAAEGLGNRTRVLDESEVWELREGSPN